MQFGKDIMETHYYEGSVTGQYHRQEESIAIDDHKELLSELLKASELLLHHKSPEVTLKILADPRSFKLKRVVVTRLIPIDE